MNDILDINNLQLTTTGTAEFLIGMLITILCSFALKYIYIKYSSSVSNKKIIANIFPLFSVAIYLIVITIKSSIVLSLGLVGALSIIRFRTAIKEAEQIVYFLVLTGVSISTAASSYIFPFLIILFVFIYANQINSKTSGKIISQNDQIVITVKKIKNSIIEKMILMLNENNIDVQIQSMNKNENEDLIVLKVSNFSLQSLDLIEIFLQKNNIDKIEIQFYSSSE